MDYKSSVRSDNDIRFETEKSKEINDLELSEEDLRVRKPVERATVPSDVETDIRVRKPVERAEESSEEESDLRVKVRKPVKLVAEPSEEEIDLGVRKPMDLRVIKAKKQVP